jgi:hypothetical protein
VLLSDALRDGELMGRERKFFAMATSAEQQVFRQKHLATG